MSETSTEARVHAAADSIERDGGKPTVATVRERAGVNNADATRYLRGWREVQASSGATIGALPAALVEQLHRVAGLMWGEASTLAAGSHAAVEREWRAQVMLQEEEITELGENLDAADQAAIVAAEAHANERTALEAALEAARADETRATAELQAAGQARADLERQLVEERVTNQTLRETLVALIARIPGADEDR